MGRLADIAHTSPPPVRRSRNAVNVLLDSDELDDADREQLMTWLTDPRTYNAPWVGSKLVEAGFLDHVKRPDQRVQEWRVQNGYRV